MGQQANGSDAEVLQDLGADADLAPLGLAGGSGAVVLAGSGERAFARPGIASRHAHRAFAQINDDAAAAGGILKTVNSAGYGLRSPARSVQQAIGYLGLDRTALLLAGLLLRKAFAHSNHPAMVRFWQDSAQLADTAAFLAAAVLYLLTVGPVRGFAFFLGLSTVLDVVVAYFFKRPLVAALGRWGWLQGSKFVGMAQVAPERVRPGLGGGSLS